MNLLFPRNVTFVLMVLTVTIGVFGVGATLGAAEASAGNPTPMANDSVPPLDQELEDGVRERFDGPAWVENTAVNIARPLISISIVGIAVGHTSVGVLGEHLTRFWVEIIPFTMLGLTAIATIQFAQKLRVIDR